MTINSTVIFVRGLPGSGKSYLAGTLANELPGSVLLDPDAVDQTSEEYKKHVETQTQEGVDPKLHLYRYSRALAFAAIKAGQTVIWNQPLNDLETFHKVASRFREFASENGVQLRLLVVEVETSPAVAAERVKARKAAGGHGPSDETFAGFVNKYISFAGAGYEVVKVSGEADAKINASIVKNALASG